MAQLYTQQKLDRIHSTRVAVDGRLYKGPTGVLYIGNSEGFLERSKDLRGDNNLQTLENNTTAIGNREVKPPSEKGEILVDNGNSIVPLPSGDPGQYMTPDPSAPTGLVWKNLPTGAGVTWSAARKRRVTDSYLEMNEVFMNEVPIVLAETVILDSIMVDTVSTETWTAEIHDDQTLIPGAIVDITGSSSGNVTGLGIELPAGTRLMFYVNGTGILRPRITIICKI